MQVGKDFSQDIRIDKDLGNRKMLSKDIHLPVTADETDEGNDSLRNFRTDLEYSVLWRWEDRPKSIFLDDLQGRFPPEATIPVVLILKELEVLRLGSEVTIALENHWVRKNLRL
jgi:hypothetical protein